MRMVYVKDGSMILYDEDGSVRLRIPNDGPLDPYTHKEPLAVTNREDLLKAAQSNDLESLGLHTKGIKESEGKPSAWRGVVNYFPRALEAIAEVSDVGAKKYVWDGWKTVPDGVAFYSDAMARHLLRESIDGPVDPSDGLHHDVKVAWNALARIELRLAARKNTGTISGAAVSAGSLLMPEVKIWPRYHVGDKVRLKAAHIVVWEVTEDLGSDRYRIVRRPALGVTVDTWAHAKELEKA